MIKPTGYYILVKMEEIENTITEGALEGFVLANDEQHEREQTGHDIGVVIAFGPTVFSGFAGIDAGTAGERCKQWGIAEGDKVEFNRYDGKVPSHPDFKDYRIIQDAMVIATIEG